MASGTSAPVKRNSFHKLSHILPSFSRPSFDSARLRTSRKSSSTKMDVARSPPAYSPTFASSDGRGSFNPTASELIAIIQCYYDNIVFAPFIFIEDPLDVNGQRGLIPEGPVARRLSTLNPSPGGMNGSSTTLLGKNNKIDPYYLITRVSLNDLPAGDRRR